MGMNASHLSQGSLRWHSSMWVVVCCGGGGGVVWWRGGGGECVRVGGYAEHDVVVSRKYWGMCTAIYTHL